MSFGFVTPWILAGLGAVALPVIIHFLTRSRPRRIWYPTFRFLVEAGSGRQALHRLRVLLVLALRCLAVAALALLFARPFLRARGAEAQPGAARRAVLVVDASMSMRAVQGGVPLFGKARAEAANTLRGLEPGSEAAVVFIGARPMAALPALSQNLAALHQALVEAEATAELGDPAAALALAQRLLGETGSITIFSDFQRTNWSAVRLDALKGIACYLRPVAEGAVDNVAITSVQLSPTEPMAGEQVELACTVFNCTAAPRQETVRLDLPGVTQEAQVALQPFSSREVAFSLSLPAVGIFPGKVSLGPDDLGDDNARYFSVSVRDALKLLVVSNADPGDHTSAAFFVSTALCPSKQASTGLTVIRRHSQDTDRNVLETANAFVIVAPAELTGEAAEIIGRRVSEGAVLLCLLDGPTSARILSALAGGSKGAVSPPFQIVRPVLAARPEGEPFGEAHVASGPLRLFADPAQADLGALRVRRHFLTELAEGRKDEVLLYFPDGSAALALSPAGRGAAAFINFSLAPGGGSVVGSPLFPALLHELLRALRRSEAERAATPGNAWQIDVPDPQGGAGQADYKVLSPEGKETEALVVSRGRTVCLALQAARLPGHYRVEATGRGAETPRPRGEGALAAVGVVNVDPRESDTREAPLDYLTEPAAAAETGGVAVLDDEGKLMRAGKVLPLWPWVAGLAAAFLAAEMLVLAFWRRAPAQAPARAGGFQVPGDR